MRPLDPPASPPTVLALVLAVDAGANEKRQANLFGVYHGLNVPAFPPTLPGGVVYLALVRGSGLTVVTVRLMAPSGESLFAFEFAAAFAHASEVRDALIHVPTVTYPAPGWYRWEVVCGAFVLYERPVLAEVTGAK